MRLARTFLIAAAAIALAAAHAADTLLVGAGAGYKRPLVELFDHYQKQSGIKVEQIYGHLGNIVNQAKESGQLTLLVGDQTFFATTPGLKVAKFVPLGEGRMVLAWTKGVPPPKDPQALTADVYKRIAVPDTKAAIYGMAASEFLANSGLAEPLKSRLQVVGTVPQVSAYLISGEVEAGFLNLTEALAVQDRIGGFQEIDHALYSPIHIGVAVLDGHQDDPAVKSLLDDLQSAEAHAILSRYGL